MKKIYKTFLKSVIALFCLSLVVLAPGRVFAAANKVSAVAISATQTGTLTAGTSGSVTYTITLTCSGGNTAGSSGISISGTVLPVGGTASFSSGSYTVVGSTITLPASSGSGTITLTINTTAATPAGTTSGITVTTDNGNSTSNTFTLVVNACSLSTIPYSESFESITAANTLPSCMAATNLSTKVKTYIAPTGSYNQAARTGTDFASFQYSCDDWIFTQGLSLTGGQTYNFSFWYVTDGLSGWTTLEAKFGNAQNSGAMTTAITGATVSGPNNTSYVQMTGTFTPSTSGTYYCGIHCLSNSTPWYLSIDDININAATPMAFSSCTTTQPNTTNVALGTTANEIICIQVVTTGSTSPLSVTSFTVNANGSTAIADINAANSAKIYYTGTSGTFATTTLFGQNTPTIANYNITGSQVLSPGTNYFWLTYDVNAAATVGDVVDAGCASLTVGSARTPSVTAPSGNRIIINQAVIGTGTTTGSYPFYTYFGYTRSASLFTAAEVGSPTVITQLSWNISTAQTTNIPVKIYLATTTATTLTASTWASLIASATLVYDATTSFTPTGWKTFDITDYIYCTDNLLVLCEANYGGTGTTSPSFYYTTATSKHETWSQDSSEPTGNGTVGNNRPNIRIDKSTAGLCSGPPTAGSVTASVNPVCAPASTVLSVTGGTTDCGLTYQWSSSPDNSTWTNIVGATSSTYIATPTANTYYRRQIICGANSSYTIGYLVSISNTVPTCATGQAPANNATGECSPVTLSWTAPVNAGCNAATGYDVYLDTSPTPTTLVSSNQAGTSYVAAGLAGNTSYYWKVVPRNVVGPATGCSILKFTTAAQNYAALPYATSFETAWLTKCGTAGVAPDQYWTGSPLTGNNAWRRDDDGLSASWGSPTSYIYAPVFSDIAHSARFHAGNASSGSIGTLDLFINLSTQPGTKVIFYDYINISGTDKLEIQGSSDGGATFSTLATQTISTAWATYAVDLASNSATYVIRFKATADYGSTDIGVDNISIVPPCLGLPIAGTATADNTSFCNTTSPLLSLSGYTLAGGITFQWQSSPTNAPYAWTDVLGGNTPTFSAPAIFQTTYYRCVVRCISDISYSNILTVTNIAENIISTNSPVSIACNTKPTLTATASGGSQVSWYAAATGGTPLEGPEASPSSYTTPTNVTANTTFYCVANSGSSNESGGMPTPTGTYQSMSVNYGVQFNATKAFTLNSATIYNKLKADIVVALQNNVGTELNSATFNNIDGDGATPLVLSLGWAVPIGTGYRLVLKTYTPDNTGTGLTYSSNCNFPYTSPSGALSVTGGWCSTYSTTYSNYHFYNLNISIPCESSPRTPVDVIVTSGVTAPVCSTTPSPAGGATGVCPVGTIISWAASTTACRAATGYKLYMGTTSGGTQVYNGLDLGNVTSFTFLSLTGGITYYWKIVPYNTAGDATGCSEWTFGTAANPGSICTTLLGSGTTTIASLPHTVNNGTTQGGVNDLTSSNLVSCGSTSYFTGEDNVYIFTPATSGTITITLTSSGTYTGLALFEGCPLAAGACGAPPGYCVGTAQSSTGDKIMTACVTAGITYYLILDSYASPTYNAFSKLIISAPTGTTTPPNDLPCNATALTLGLTAAGDNSCASAAQEPTTAPTCWTTGVRNTVWYSVVAPASGQIVINAQTGTLTNTQIAVYSGTCGSTMVPVSGACNNDISGCGSSLASSLTLTGLVPAATYYIAVDGAYDLQGSFTIQVIDPATMSIPLTPGQDCSSSFPLCQTYFSIPDPGYANTGAVCDFDGTDNCTGGERASLYYTITIASGGTLQFDIIPNDYDGTNGSETDYDFLIWKIAGSGTLASCSSLQTNSAQGLMACNYSYLGVTGLYPGGSGNPDYNGGTVWDAAYEAPITTAAGDQYLLCISNFTQSTSGFTIDFNSSGGTCVINTAAAPAALYWTGGTSTAWSATSPTANWSGCTLPTCLTDAVINPAIRQPVISTNVTCKDLIVNLGATLTINAGCTLYVCGNFYNNGTIVCNGTIEFIGSVPQTYTNSSTTPLKHVTMNQVVASTLTLNSDLLLSTTGILTLTKGKIVTGSKLVVANNTATTAVSVGNTTSYVEGNLRRFILSTGSYDFPVGHAAKGYQRSNINFTAATTIQYLTAYFTPYASLPTISISDCSSTFTTAIDNGYWRVLPYPVANKNSGNYTMTLYNLNYTNSASTTGWTIISDHTNTASNWQTLNGDGTTSNCVASPITAVQRTGMRGFSDFGTGAASGTLPIELLTFSGKKVGQKNFLEWVTGTEINNDYFVLEKSNSGILFDEITIIDGAGNSNGVLTYSFLDNEPHSPVTYYKLKQVDFDGRYTYSDIISVNENPSSNDPSIIQLYPNPALTSVNIDLYSPVNTDVKVEIYDYLGVFVVSETTKLNNGQTTLNYNIDELANGVYCIRVYFEELNFVDYKNFIKQ